MIMNVIPNNIQAKEFRYRAECRDQLQHKGDLYVGTGTTEEVALDDGTTKNMCKTEPLYRTTDGLVPASDDSNQPTNGMALVIDNSNSTGWKVGQIETAGIKNRAITEAKLSKEYYIKNKSIDFVSDRATGDLPHISWTKLSFTAGRHSTLILQAPIPSTERTTTILNLPVINSVGTLVTKEQLEKGEIAVNVPKIGYRHFFHYQFRLPGSGSGPQPSIILFEIINESKNRLVEDAYIERDITSLWQTAKGIVANGFLLTQTAIDLGGVDTLAANSLYNIVGIELDVHGEPYMIVFNNNPEIGKDGDMQQVKLSQLTKTSQICEETIIPFAMS